MLLKPWCAHQGFYFHEQHNVVLVEAVVFFSHTRTLKCFGSSFDSYNLSISLSSHISPTPCAVGRECFRGWRYIGTVGKSRISRRDGSQGTKKKKKINEFRLWAIWRAWLTAFIHRHSTTLLKKKSTQGHLRVVLWVCLICGFYWSMSVCGLGRKIIQLAFVLFVTQCSAWTNTGGGISPQSALRFVTWTSALRGAF